MVGGEAQMFRSCLICLLVAAAGLAQDPFQPLKLDGDTPVADASTARRSWVNLTNAQMEMAHKTLRVDLDNGGLTAVVLAKGVVKPRHARPILTGKGDYGALFKSIVGLGFDRIVVRNPDTRQEWAARLERGKAILED
jgi:hypothetical protein